MGYLRKGRGVASARVSVFQSPLRQIRRQGQTARIVWKPFSRERLPDPMRTLILGFAAGAA